MDRRPPCWMFRAEGRRGEVPHLRCDGIYKNKALAILHVEVAHRGELLRAGRVQNLKHAVLSIDLDLGRRVGQNKAGVSESLSI